MPAPKGRSKSAKKPTPLELLRDDISTKQTHIDELTSQISTLRKSIDFQSAEENRLRLKLQIILPEIIAHRDRQRFPLEPVNDIVDVNETYVREMIQCMIDDLQGRQSQKSLIEQRVEELEQRVTEQNDNYQSIFRKNLACMRGVGDALKSSSPHEIKFLLRRLKQDLLLEEPMRRPASAPAGPSRLFSLTQLSPAEQESPLADLNTEYLKSMETSFVSLPRPVRKESGDTHIKYLLPDIKEALCTELAVESNLRGDWRQFAHLVGVSTETIQFWRRLELRSPMEQVMNYWKDSDSASVRLLHRILMSESVRAMNLAKLVSEFYNVD